MKNGLVLKLLPVQLSRHINTYEDGIKTSKTTDKPFVDDEKSGTPSSRAQRL